MRFLAYLFLVCGAIAGALVSELVPAGLQDLCDRELQRQDFILTRQSDDLVEITDSQWFFLPLLWGDFDLQMDLEISEGAEIDVMLRQVEPRFVDEVMQPFPGRFSVLRLSSEGDGIGWRTREEALFGPRGGGVGLMPGYLATVWIQARGRQLRANVAGKWQPWFEADDVYGMFAMVARGGKAVLHRFEIKPSEIGRAWLWSRWTWAGFGLLGAALVAAAAGMLCSRPRFLLAGIGMPLAAWLLVPMFTPDLAFPDPLGMLLLLGGSLLIGAMLVADGVRGLWLLGVAALAAMCVWLAGIQLGSDSREVDEWFGPAAGSQISEAHAQLVRTPLGLHDTDFDGPCVFLLGGQLIYGLGSPEQQLGLQLSQQLRGTLGTPVEVPFLGTGEANAAQQWRLFERFYAGFHPRVIVLGVDVFESEPDASTGLPRSSPAQLREVVAKVEQWCAAHDSHLVLYATADVSSDLLASLREQQVRGLSLVVAKQDEACIETARRLRDAVVPHLR